MMSLLDFTTDTNEYPISSVARNEWLSFAMYTVESRAIPNMIDGLKPVQRFYLYSSILNSKRDFKKVSAVAGIISDYGYNHGEASAAGAGQLMAATWNNNVCLVEGRGSFGTRLVQSAGAPRYVYTRLSENFEKYISDVDLAPAHPDPEHEPPMFYLPVIPLVLVNGTKGIATGFATSILPRSPESLSGCVRDYLSSGNITAKPQVHFPEFNGNITFDPDEGRYIVYGKFHKTSKTQLTITEVPYGFDRESYVKILDKLEDEGEIVSYDDMCDKQGFRFEIKLKQTGSSSWTDEKVIRKFKLAKPLSENLTVIDYNGKLREYTDERDLIKDFCDYRLGILQQRIEKRMAEANEEVRWLNVKMQFIQSVLDDRIAFKNQKKKQVGVQILANTDADESDIDRLLRVNIMSLTDEMVKELQRDIRSAKTELTFWTKTTPKAQFLSDLDGVD